MRRKARTPLEYALMCLVSRRPSTGYEITRLLREYPLAGHGKSPGAVYPALDRLIASGLVLSRGRIPRRLNTPRERWEGRTIREHGLTRAGVVELRRWATAPVTRAEMLERPEHLLLRFSVVIGLAGGKAGRRFVAEYRCVAGELVQDLSRSLGEARRDASDATRLWIELSLRLAKSRLNWARRAEADLRRRMRVDPALRECERSRNTRAALQRVPPDARRRLAWPHGDRSRELRISGVMKRLLCLRSLIHSGVTRLLQRGRWRGRGGLERRGGESTYEDG